MILGGLFSVVVLVVAVIAAFAQEVVPTPAPIPPDYGQKLFDLGMMFLITVVGPVITTFMKTAPQWVRYMITAIVSVGGGALTGEFTSVPFNPDTLAMIAGSISLSIQKALHTPRPEVVKAEQEAVK
jgi:hypothetical protein